MITPALWLAGEDEDRCVFIALEHHHPEGAWLRGEEADGWYALRELAEGGRVSEPIFAPIDEMARVIDGEVVVEVTVASDRFWLQRRVAVPVVDQE